MALYSIRLCPRCSRDCWRKNAVDRERHGGEATRVVSYTCIYCSHTLHRATVRPVARS